MSLIPVIEQVVSDKVTAAEMFTAHDVTLEVRKRGHFAKHNDVRDAVHDCYGRGLMGPSYGKTNISVPGGNPVLYYPFCSDPSTYGNIRSSACVPAVGNSSITLPPVNSSVSIPTPSTTNFFSRRSQMNKPGQQSNRCVDYRGTLSIPTALVKQAGFKAGDKVVLRSSAKSAELVVASTANLGHAKYTVDKYGQIRVTKNALVQAGLDGKFFDIDLDKTGISIKLHS